jgi:DNA-binding Lrp family transcriptional regulator
MSRPRGNATSKAERAARQAKALQLMEEGATQEAIAQLLGVSRTTFWRDLQAIEARYVEGSKEDVAAFKKSQYDALIRIESATAEGSIEPEVANALVRVRESVARLLGLNAETRHLRTNVNVSAAVEPNLYQWVWRLFELCPVEEKSAMKAEIEAVAAKYAKPRGPLVIEVPAHILQEPKHDRE